MAAGSKAREILNYSFLVALADNGLIDDGELAYVKSRQWPMVSSTSRRNAH
jgi:hypothetical protein